MNYLIALIILSLNTLNSSLFKPDYAGRDPLSANYVIEQLQTRRGWTARHSNFVEVIAADPQGWAERYDSTSRKPRLTGGEEIFQAIYATMFSPVGGDDAFDRGKRDDLPAYAGAGAGAGAGGDRGGASKRDDGGQSLRRYVAAAEVYQSIATSTSHAQLCNDAALARALDREGRTSTSHAQLFHDAALACALDREDKRFIGADSKQCENDAAMALALSQSGASYGRIDPVWMPKAVRECYANYDADVKAKVTRDMDVHVFNAATKLKTRLPIFLEHDKFSDPRQRFAQTCSAIKASSFYTTFNKKDVLVTNLAALGAHIAANRVEASETGTNVEELFSRVWSLSYQRDACLKQLFLALCDNTETGGGCYPGHAGRLAQLYVNLLRINWI